MPAKKKTERNWPRSSWFGNAKWD